MFSFEIVNVILETLLTPLLTWYLLCHPLIWPLTTWTHLILLMTIFLKSMKLTVQKSKTWTKNQELKLQMLYMLWTLSVIYKTKHKKKNIKKQFMICLKLLPLKDTGKHKIGLQSDIQPKVCINCIKWNKAYPLQHCIKNSYKLLTLSD